AVKFAESPRVRAAKGVAIEHRMAPAPNPIDKALDDADRLYGGKDYERAKQAYLRILEQTSDHALHARAYYGLARIAVLQNDPEMGERLFQKVLDSSPDAWIKAWAHVYLGRLS